jgi:hypothetical protein
VYTAVRTSHTTHTPRRHRPLAAHTTCTRFVCGKCAVNESVRGGRVFVVCGALRVRVCVVSV